MPGADIYLLLDGVLSVAVDGTQIGELGPGTVVGERALLEDGRRTATLRAVIGCVIATAARDLIDRDRLARLAERHHQEGPDSQAPRGNSVRHHWAICRALVPQPRVRATAPRMVTP